MRIANGVEMLEISATMMGKVDVVHPTLIWDKDNILLIDTGYPGQLTLIREAMRLADVPFGGLSKIIISHQDLDHIGSLPSILKESEQVIEVIANEVEKPYIQGDKQLVKLTPEAIAHAESTLPENVPAEWRKAFISVLKNPPHAPVQTIVTDGEELPYCGGITVINTPGHTPGHISLYHKPSKTLIAADAMIVEAGQLHGPIPEQSFDYKLAMHSLRKLTAYDIETVICYHGGIFSNNPNSRIAELAGLAQK
jgi:glyoxylase-like metal-dependent hydrolase (beta-lactamase superfamily II)